MTRIPDEWLDAVFFLGTRSYAGHVDHPRWGGTGFVLTAPNEFLPGARHLYLVTARHNIERALQDGNLWLRFNTAEGRAIMVETDPGGPWVFHDDETVDVAIANPAAVSDLRLPFALSTEQIFTEHEAEVFDFGIGSELLTMGLFGNREGVERNTPVVRTGIVAAMLGEAIDDGTGYGPYRAYLAEILSMGGLSGSPVLFHPTAGTEFPKVSFYLLGIIRSHWDERPPETPSGLPRREWLNRGIAAITPATAITDMLGTEAMKADRKRNAHRLRRS